MFRSLALRVVRPLLVVGLAVGFGAGVSAELAKPLTLAEKATIADAVVHARCTATETEWRNGKVFTTARFEVIDDLRGNGMAQIEITSPGGTAVHPVLNVAITTRVSDTAPIAVDDEVIMFARRHDGQEFRVLAGAQGYLKIVRDADGAARVRTVERRVVAQPAPRDQAGGARLEQATYTLDQYKQRVRSRLSADK